MILKRKYFDDVESIMSHQLYALTHFYKKINIDEFTYRGVCFCHLIAQFCVTIAQYLRFLHFPALLDTSLMLFFQAEITSGADFSYNDVRFSPTTIV
jgi:hypothetical protein